MAMEVMCTFLQELQMHGGRELSNRKCSGLKGHQCPALAWPASHRHESGEGPAVSMLSGARQANSSAF